MIKIIHILFLVTILSCKSHEIIGQKQEEAGSPSPKIEKPKFVGSTDELVSPGTVRVRALFIDNLKTRELCTHTKKTTITIKVQRIIGSGSSIVNMVQSNKDIVIAVPSYMVDKLPEKEITTSLLLKENLCRDMNRTYYSVIKFY